MAQEKKYKILIADDEPSVRQSLCYVFQKEGYEVCEAEDGEAAIAKAAELSPNIIIIDYSMPVIGGWEAAKRIRELKSCRLTPIIGYTAYSDDESRSMGFANGLNEILLKPLDLDELKSIISDYLTTGNILSS